MKEKKSYTVQDVLNAECTLEPLRCIHCGHIGEVTFLQYVGDGQCGVCGKWQIGETDNKVLQVSETCSDVSM